MSASPDPVAGSAYWATGPWHRGVFRAFPGTGRSPAWRSLMAGIWLVYLVPLVAGTFGSRNGVSPSPLYTGGAVAIAVVFAAVYIAVIGWWDQRRWFTLPGLAVLAGLATLACVSYGSGAAPVWIYVAVACGIAIGSQWGAMRAIAGTAACYSAFTLAGHVKTGDFLSGLLPLLFGGLAALGARVRCELNRELTRAEETVARLAASEERLRLARDMHDLTGQSLSMITLKSDLAARLLGRLPPVPSAIAPSRRWPRSRTSAGRPWPTSGRRSAATGGRPWRSRPSPRGPCWTPPGLPFMTTAS